MNRTSVRPAGSPATLLNRSLLVRLLGFPATLIHVETLTLDRWLWLAKRLPKTSHGEKLIDVGCGRGAFTIGAALRGYNALGLSWDEKDLKVARERAEICGAPLAAFEVMDIRHIDTRKDWIEAFDIAVCLEAVEHILDDRKLVGDIAACLKPGGRLFLTTPYLHYRAILPEHNGPFSEKEDGGHVRRGYTEEMLMDLCAHAGLVYQGHSFCSGFLSQKISFLNWTLSRFHPVLWMLGWGVVLPLRILPPLFDRAITRCIRWPYFSICLDAYKPPLANG